MSHAAATLRCSILTLSIATLAACQGPLAPTVEVQGMRISETTADAAAVEFEVRMVNPNDEPLELHEFRYSLQADGTTTYVGRRAAQATLAAHDERTALIPAVIPYHVANWPGAVSPSGTYVLAGELEYRAPGALREFLFDAGVLRPTVGFSDAGEMAPGR